MNAAVRVYENNAEAYALAGLPAFPVDTRNKKPAVRGWQKATPQLARHWALIPTLGKQDGLGIVMGMPSGITEVDVDAVGDAWLAAAVEQFGDTPVVIRTASGKAKLWYRHDGERRHIRPFNGQPIDILGGGFTIAPPSWREDLSAHYGFRKGGLEEIERLPFINPEARDFDFRVAAEGVRQGKRNDSLWRYCMAQARHCDDEEALLDVAETWAQDFPDPLGLAEVKKCVRSAWKYERSGRNFLGLRKPQVTDCDRTMDALLDKPEAFVLLQYFKRWHSNRPFFAIAPAAMSEKGSPPWSRRKIIQARDVLLERGFIEELVAPQQGRNAGRYRLS